MQRFILSKKNHITLVSAILIVIGFSSELGFKNEVVAVWTLVIASILGALPIAIQAYQALKVKVVSIDVLVTIAVAGAFFIRNFEESAIVIFLFLFGAFLEQRTLNKTRSAIKELTEMAPESALKQMANGEFEEVEVDEVDVGDILLVKTGGKIPVDGTVLSGEGSINEASITGESLPVSKEKGSNVFAGTILDNGTIQITADRVGEDTTFGKIIELVEEAQDSKSEAERFIDRFSKYYTPAVLVLGILVWAFSRNLELAITILVLGCPGALVIGVPVSNVAGIGNGARHGVLLKGSEVIGDFSRLVNIINKKVHHKVFGEGVALSLDGSYLLVEFPVGHKKFIYPDAFDGFLSAEDSDVALEIRHEIETAKQAKAKAKQQTIDIHIPLIKEAPNDRSFKKTKKTSRANIAFKCNFCDGGQSSEQIGFHGVCSDNMIRNNIAIEHRTWCTAEDCPCLHYYNGDISREELDDLCVGDGFVCYESQMLRDWKALAGVVQNGENKSKPMTLRKVQQNSLCVLTTRDPGSDEKERYIFAVFLVDDSYEGDGNEEGYVSTQSKYKIKLSPSEARTLLFWNYHANSNQPEITAWNSGLHRYFGDEQAATILQDIWRAKAGTSDETLAREFLDHFCRINGVDLERIGAASGALNFASK